MADEYDEMTYEQLGTLFEEYPFEPPGTEEEIAFIAWCRSIYRLGQQHERDRWPDLPSGTGGLLVVEHCAACNGLLTLSWVDVAGMRLGLWSCPTCGLYNAPVMAATAGLCRNLTRATSAPVMSYCRLPAGHDGLCEV